MANLLADDNIVDIIRGLKKRVDTLEQLTSVTALGASKFGDGTSTATINIGDSNIKLDGPNKRILINDGSDDRVLLGFLSGGF